MQTKTTIKTVNDYIAGFPEAVQVRLNALRHAIKKAVPEAEESISYQMPAFKLNGPLVYFAAYKNHIGFYPTASPISAFKNEIAGYKSAKGSVQFPLDQPLPLELITKMVQYKAVENLQKKKRKK